MKIEDVYDVIYKLDRAMNTLQDKICLTIDKERVALLEYEYEVLRKCKKDLLQLDLNDIGEIKNSLVKIATYAMRKEFNAK